MQMCVMFVYILLHLCVTIIIREKAAIRLRKQCTWEELEGKEKENSHTKFSKTKSTIFKVDKRELLEFFKCSSVLV